MKNVALITGASSGIGYEFAHLHAKKTGDLVVVARSGDKLESLKQQLEEKYQRKVKVLVKDLSRPGAAREIYQAVANQNISLSYLINNAGFGGRGAFHEREWSQDQSMIQVNVMALTELTHLFLPDFVKKNRGRILNVSSTASLTPGPLQAVYFATKAYVAFFSNALSEELRETKVTVTNLMPGATSTGFANAANMENTDLFKRATSAYDVAFAGYEGMMKGKRDITAGVSLSQKMLLGLIPFVPKGIRLGMIRKMQEEN